MSRIRTFLIGRHQDCDLRFADSSVSRRHAEVVVTPDGRYYLTDRKSTCGTFIHTGGGWRSLQQEFVHPTARLRFGDHEIAASCLERLRSPQGGGKTALELDRDSVNNPQRNPETGEVIEKP